MPGCASLRDKQKRNYKRQPDFSGDMFLQSEQPREKTVYPYRWHRHIISLALFTEACEQSYQGNGREKDRVEPGATAHVHPTLNDVLYIIVAIQM
jgi:hypothetical protein